DQKRPRAVNADDALSPAHARVGLERDATQPAADAAASGAADPVPDGVAAERRERSQNQDEREAQSTRAGERSRGKKDGRGGNRQPDLLGEDPAEDDHVTVPDEKDRKSVV